MAALAPAYRPRKPTETLLYSVVGEHIATFLAHARETYQSPLPRYVQNELRGYLRCGVFAHGFVRAHCEACGHDLLVAFSCKARAACPSCAGRRMANTAAHLVDRVLPSVPVRQWVLSLPFELRRLAAFDAKVLTAFVRIFTEALADRYRRCGGEQGRAPCESGAVTFVQRFGSSLNLNVHFHVVMLDGVFVRDADARAIFHAAPPPSTSELGHVVERTRDRIRAWLVRHGYMDTTPLEECCNEAPLQTSLDACADIAMRRGTIETNARWEEEGAAAESDSAPPRGADAFARDGFNLHASVRIAAHDDLGRERLCRYGARPPFSLERLRRLPHGQLGYRIKKTRGGGAKVLRMTPLELLARLAALVPPPRYPLVRYHGVLAPRSPWRKSVVPRAPSLAIASRHVHTEKSPDKKQEERGAGARDRDARSIGASKNGDGLGSKAARPNSSCEASDPSTALIAPNVIAVHHWERLCGGLLFATSPRVPWATLLRRTFEVDVLTCTQCSGRLRILGAVEDPIAAREILERLGLPTEVPAQVRARDPTLLKDSGTGRDGRVARGAAGSERAGRRAP